MALILTPRQLTQRSEFYHQLGQVTAAGIGLTNALDMLSRNAPAKSYRAPLQQIVKSLGQGDTFTESLSRLGHWTPSFDIALIGAGEKSGRLDAVFKLLGNYYAERGRLLRQMLTDLAYPVFVFHFAVLLMPFLDFFIHNSLRAFWLITFGVLIPLHAAVFGFIYASQGRHGEVWRSALEKIVRPIPVLGTARHFLALSRLAAALEALLNAGVTIIEAWDLAAAASGSPAIVRAVAAWRPRVVAGVTPAEVVGESPQFPELFANLYRSGEISGQLDESLLRLHAYYNEEGIRKLRLVAQWWPRAVYMLVALIVGYVVISIFSGYYNEVQKAIGD